MRKFYLSVTLLFFSLLSFSQGVVPDWLSHLGGTSGTTIVQSVKADAAGKVYVGGSFSGTANFNPLGAPIGLSSTNGTDDGFVALYGTQGTLLWVQQIESASEASVLSIDIDASGNVYYTGYYSGITTVTTIPLPVYGIRDFLIGRFNVNGSAAWAHGYGSSGYEIGIDIDHYGSSVYVTGAFSNTVNFDPLGIQNLSSQGGVDGFFAQYLEDGSLNATILKDVGSPDGDDFGLTISAGINGLYLGGQFSGSDFDFDPPSGYRLDASGSDGFFARYENAPGAPLQFYASVGGESGVDNVSHIALDGDENMYLSGSISGAATFPTNTSGSITGIIRNSNGASDAFVAKYDASTAGNVFPVATWIKSFGGTDDDFSNFVTTDVSGNVYVTGAFHGTVDFGGSGASSSNTADGLDAFFIGFKSDGTLKFAKQLSSSGENQGTSISLNYPHAFVGGVFQGTVDFGVPGSPLNTAASGDYDGFAGRFILEPETQPSNLNFSNQLSTSFNYDFLDPSIPVGGYLNIHKAGSPPTFVPQDGVTYSVSTLPDGSKIDYIDNIPNGTLSGLAPGTDYYVTIYAFNSNDEGGGFNYLTTNPLTGSTSTTGSPLVSAPLFQPTDLEFNYNEGSFLSISFAPASDSPSGYVVLRKKNSAPTGVPQNGTIYHIGDVVGNGVVAYSGLGTTFDDTNVSLDGSIYYYAVFSFNSDPSTTDATIVLQDSPLEGHTDDSGPDIFVEVIPSVVGDGVTPSTTAQVSDTESGIQFVSIEFALPDDSDFSDGDEVEVTDDLDNKYSYTWPQNFGNEHGLIYHFYAVNGAGIEVQDEDHLITQEFDDLTIPFAGIGTSQNNYRMISVPLVAVSPSTVNSIFGDDLPSSDHSKWRMFHYANGKNNELSSSSPIELGKSYWLISSTNVTLGSGPAAVAVASFESGSTITIKSGWNQIGDPYLYNVLWSDVLDYNSDKGTDVSEIGSLHAYGGSWGPASKLKPFEGEFVFSDATADITLEIPAFRNPDAGRKQSPMQDLHKNTIDSNDWIVSLAVSSGDVSYDLGGFGMVDGAIDGLDHFDEVNLPPMFEYIELDHTQKSASGFPLSRDVVPPAENHIWEFVIKSNVSSPETLITWDNSYFGTGGKGLVLWDEALQKSINMRELSACHFNRSTSGKFKVIYGSPEFVRENTRANSLQLYAIIPNPVEDHMKVAFTLPHDENNVEIGIYNLMGQRINTLAKGPFEEGYHEIKWEDQSKMPVSGVYLIEVQTSDAMAVKRVLFK